MSLEQLRFDDLLDRLAAKTPAPGGGAAAPLSASIGVALTRMVIAYSIGKKSLAAHREQLTAADRRLAVAVDLLVRLADEDSAAYSAMNELLRLPEDDQRRAEELPSVASAAVNVPMSVIATCSDVLRLLRSLTAISNPQLLSDLAIGAVLVEAAARASRWNVVANAAFIQPPERRAGILDEADDMLASARSLVEAIERECRPAS